MKISISILVFTRTSSYLIDKLWKYIVKVFHFIQIISDEKIVYFSYFCVNSFRLESLKSAFFSIVKSHDFFRSIIKFAFSGLSSMAFLIDLSNFFYNNNFIVFCFGVYFYQFTILLFRKSGKTMRCIKK
ncbi:hypothetical protein DYD83_00690 [Dickeya fangzhongdai]|uniref:Uncharacterized protein n=1 Tax=Dickeya fangzhongdai TaxID=1778540 RepID=A0A2K8QHV9_9GAMM|nr:hypothetical protein CVE23_00650 [Dickeya fangzhongdai]QOH46047.1 hypothetical protein DYD82_00680 [Dickeya fangzhongdai]QOH50355.1 hypothetical protein DYD83_00690 [Dickeya fangzhongdai]